MEEKAEQKRPASKIIVAALVASVAIIAYSGVRLALKGGSGDAATAEMSCGEAFYRRGARCCPTPDPLQKLGDGLCAVGPFSSARPPSCPAPLVMTPRGCDTPERSVVRIPETTVLVGPSDWEAEGRVKSRSVHAGPFDIDRFEMSIGHARCPTCPEKIAPRLDGRDVARAASYLTLFEAREVCAAHGGRLPTEDEWIVAAAGAGGTAPAPGKDAAPRRYPWGDTGAVCRRAAWGLMRGPCGNGATGPDTVGSHPDGATPLGIHDLAGNVAEWVETGAACEAGVLDPEQPGRVSSCLAVVRGGSYTTDLATELRTWVRSEVPAESHEATIGFRCAYDVHVN